MILKFYCCLLWEGSGFSSSYIWGLALQVFEFWLGWATGLQAVHFFCFCVGLYFTVMHLLRQGVCSIARAVNIVALVILGFRFGDLIDNL